MLRVKIEHLRPGLVIARNIYNTNGNLLLAHNTVLDDSLIKRLTLLDIDSVYVKNPNLECDFEPQEILSDKTKQEATKITQRTFKNLQKSKVVDIAGFQQAVKLILNDVIYNRNALIHLTDIRTHNDYTFGHSINACLISSIIGLKMQLPKNELNELALGVLLHDVGKIMVPTRILDKKEPLSGEEWQVLKNHSTDGFQFLRKNHAISLPAAQVAYQHHENYDGTGYPLGVAGETIHEYARIASVADLYDAITSDRPYRHALLPHEAYEIVLGSRGTKLDPKITDIFLENVALYPLGTMVLLDTEEIGVVVESRPKLQARPKVKIVFDPNGQRIPGKEKFLDLAQELTRFITKVFKPEEILSLFPDSNANRQE